MIKFKSLSSGSCGNCYFLGSFDEQDRCTAGILIDAGVSPRRLRKELALHSLGYSDFSAILITHDHNDHIRSLGSYCKHVGVPVWTTPELARALTRHWVVENTCPDAAAPSTRVGTKSCPGASACGISSFPTTPARRWATQSSSTAGAMST